MKRVLVELLWFCAFLAISLGAISFWFSLSFSWVFEPLLFVSTLLAVFGFSDRAIFAASVFGVMFDLFSALPFGIGVVSFMASVSLVLFSQQTFFKEQAIHTIIIHTLLAVCSYHLVFFLCTLIARQTGIVGADALYTFNRAATVAGVQSVCTVGSIVLVYVSTLVFRRGFIHTTTV